MGRSPWVWTPAAVGTAGMATATVAFARLLTRPPSLLPARPLPWLLSMRPQNATDVVLRGPAAAAPGRWGVEWPDGWGDVGEPLWADGDAAVRTLQMFAGTRPAGAVTARFNACIWANREMFSAATGIAGTDLEITGETGPLPAWLFPGGDGTRWSVMVHGRGAHRAQMLRLVPALHAQGITALIISYRNDQPECTDPSGRMHFGQREWVDLEAAVCEARRRGATSFVLAGMSMGGGIIATYLRRSESTAGVVGTILDAPALNWGPILRHVARGARVPQWLVPGVMAAAALQARIDWRALNHSGPDHRPTIPVLLIHGDRDPVVPVAISDAFAESAPDVVTYLRVNGAGHVSGYNTAPAAYERAVRDFLGHLGSPASGV